MCTLCVLYVEFATAFKVCVCVWGGGGPGVFDRSELGVGSYPGGGGKSVNIIMCAQNT